MIRIAINGYGRIGRSILRAVYENKYRDKIQIAGINNITCIETSTHLTKYDSTHGVFDANVSCDDKHIIINEDQIFAHQERDPNKLPWSEENIDVVFECSGKFNDGQKANAHINAGAKKVLISAPAKNVDKTIVYGVNHQDITNKDVIISNASCTTNCLAPIAKILDEEIGIVSGLMTTIHAMTNDQILLDARHKDLRRARAATQSMIPTKTGAAASIGLVLPNLKGKLDGLAVRVPTTNVSLVDLTFQSSKSTSADEINELIISASKNSYKGVIGINDKPLVSIDFNHTTPSAVFDTTQTKVTGDIVKILAWYDNEWAFSNRMLDVALEMFREK
ncbi:MAG: type I glyceraldehyde-3-phosphate dehydrogenase [Legionellales bacterium]|nr:type I glyceraldehyde-3-phosphate dehydrogenase [Legionellales bacterium]